MHLFLSFRYEICPNTYPYGIIVPKDSISNLHKFHSPKTSQDHAHHLCLGTIFLPQMGQQILKYTQIPFHSFLLSHTIQHSPSSWSQMFVFLPSAFKNFHPFSKRNYPSNLPITTLISKSKISYLCQISIHLLLLQKLRTQKASNLYFPPSPTQYTIVKLGQENCNKNFHVEKKTENTYEI